MSYETLEAIGLMSVAICIAAIAAWILEDDVLCALCGLVS